MSHTAAKISVALLAALVFALLSTAGADYRPAVKVKCGGKGKKKAKSKRTAR